MGRSALPVERGPFVCLAQVATAHGVRGDLRLRAFTEDPAGIGDYGPLCDGEGRELFKVTVKGHAKGGVIVRAEGIGDRDAALALRGLYLYVPRSRLPATEPDEFYHADLVGLEAFGTDGASRGRVVAVHNHGAGDMIEIEARDGESLLLPFTQETVPEIDVAGGRLVVDPPLPS